MIEQSLYIKSKGAGRYTPPRRTSKTLPINSIDSKCRRGTHIHRRPHESNFKKPGARRPFALGLTTYILQGVAPTTHPTPYFV